MSPLTARRRAGGSRREENTEIGEQGPRLLD